MCKGTCMFQDHTCAGQGDRVPKMPEARGRLWGAGGTVLWKGGVLLYPPTKVTCTLQPDGPWPQPGVPLTSPHC